MLHAMKPIMREPAASAVVVIDAARGATMSEIAAASGRSLSTIQRGIEGLLSAGVLRRTTPRGLLVFRPDAPRRAIREIADWTLGRTKADKLVAAARDLANSRAALPATVKSPALRRSLPVAIDRIVKAYHPDRVILFGSQARGDARSDSDVDLLVVFRGDVDRRARQVQIRTLLRDAPFAKDVLVASAEDLPNAPRGTALAEAAHDGLVVYER